MILGFVRPLCELQVFGPHSELWYIRGKLSAYVTAFFQGEDKSIESGETTISRGMWRV